MASEWAYLPKNLLDSVLERLLSSRDYLRFSIVCKPWFRVAQENQSRHKKMLSHHQEPPMLLFFNPKVDAWCLYNVLDNKILNHVQLKMPNKRFCGSCKGWLIVVEEDFSMTLINPFLRSKEKKIHLPQLVSPDAREAWCDREKEARTELFEPRVWKAIITADPITNANECIVVVTDGVGKSPMAFTRIGEDKWTFIDTECCRRAIGVIQREDKLSVLDENGDLITFSITSDSYSVVSRFACSFPPVRYTFAEYLVQQSHENELLLVLGHDKFDPSDRRHRILEFLVFKYDFDKCMWIEKISLGDDVAIFIGGNVSIYVAASNFPRCKPDCIYYGNIFEGYHSRKLHQFAAYDMKTREISESYSRKVMNLLKMNVMKNHYQRVPIWFTPTFYL